MVEDGLEVVRGLLPEFIRMIVKSARWVHPDSFRYLPVWYPAYYRTAPLYKADWATRQTNRSKRARKEELKVECNVQAAKALAYALGLGSSKSGKHWTCCHIWGVDDPNFGAVNTIIKDPRYYSCVGNMVRLPSPLASLTDTIPEIKQLLRVCSLHLYGWACEHKDVSEQAKRVLGGEIPADYPDEWPTSERKVLPPGTLPFNKTVKDAADRRRSKIKSNLLDENLPQYPRDKVREVLNYWRQDWEKW